VSSRMVKAPPPNSRKTVRFSPPRAVARVWDHAGDLTNFTLSRIDAALRLALEL